MKYDYLDYEQIKKMGERIKISRKRNPAITLPDSIH